MSETRDEMPAMQTYVRKPEPPIRAVQWHKPGDHPGVEAEQETGLHHLLDETGDVIDSVEASDWIVETATGGLRVAPDDIFRATYQPAPAPAAPPRGAAEGDGAKPRSRGPSREWLERAGDIEDQCRSVSVGGLAVDTGMYGVAASLAQEAKDRAAAKRPVVGEATREVIKFLAWVANDSDPRLSVMVRFGGIKEHLGIDRINAAAAEIGEQP